MTTRSRVNLTVINRHNGKVLQIKKEDIFDFSGVGVEKTMMINKDGENYAIDIDYYQFFISLAP